MVSERHKHPFPRGVPNVLTTIATSYRSAVTGIAETANCSLPDVANATQRNHCHSESTLGIHPLLSGSASVVHFR